MGLLELAAQVEGLEPGWEGSHPLNGMIHALMPEPKAIVPPDYLRSLDAAMSLVPEGLGLRIERYWIARRGGPVWSAEIARGGLPGSPRQVFECFDATTPALALTAAALRARAKEAS